MGEKVYLKGVKNTMKNLKEAKGTDKLAFTWYFIGAIVFIGGIVIAASRTNSPYVTEAEQMTALLVFLGGIIGSISCFTSAVILKNQGAIAENQRAIMQMISGNEVDENTDAEEETNTDADEETT